MATPQLPPAIPNCALPSVRVAASNVPRTVNTLPLPKLADVSVNVPSLAVLPVTAIASDDGTHNDAARCEGNATVCTTPRTVLGNALLLASTTCNEPESAATCDAEAGALDAANCQFPVKAAEVGPVVNDDPLPHPARNGNSSAGLITTTRDKERTRMKTGSR